MKAAEDKVASARIKDVLLALVLPEHLVEVKSLGTDLNSVLIVCLVEARLSRAFSQLTPN